MMWSLFGVLGILAYAEATPTAALPSNQNNCIKLNTERENAINNVIEKLISFLNKIQEDLDDIDIRLIKIDIDKHSEDEKEDKDLKLKITVNDCDSNNRTVPKSDKKGKKNRRNRNKKPKVINGVDKNVLKLDTYEVADVSFKNVDNSESVIDVSSTATAATTTIAESNNFNVSGPFDSLNESLNDNIPVKNEDNDEKLTKEAEIISSVGNNDYNNEKKYESIGAAEAEATSASSDGDFDNIQITNDSYSSIGNKESNSGDIVYPGTGVTSTSKNNDSDKDHITDDSSNSEIPVNTVNGDKQVAMKNNDTTEPILANVNNDDVTTNKEKLAPTTETDTKLNNLTNFDLIDVMRDSPNIPVDTSSVDTTSTDVESTTDVESDKEMYNHDVADFKEAPDSSITNPVSKHMKIMSSDTKHQIKRKRSHRKKPRLTSHGTTSEKEDELNPSIKNNGRHRTNHHYDISRTDPITIYLTLSDYLNDSDIVYEIDDSLDDDEITLYEKKPSPINRNDDKIDEVRTGTKGEGVNHPNDDKITNEGGPNPNNRNGDQVTPDDKIYEFRIGTKHDTVNRPDDDMIANEEKTIPVNKNKDQVTPDSKNDEVRKVTKGDGVNHSDDDMITNEGEPILNNRSYDKINSDDKNYNARTVTKGVSVNRPNYDNITNKGKPFPVNNRNDQITPDDKIGAVRSVTKSNGVNRPIKKKRRHNKKHHENLTIDGFREFVKANSDDNVEKCVCIDMGSQSILEVFTP